MNKNIIMVNLKLNIDDGTFDEYTVGSVVTSITSGVEALSDGYAIYTDEGSISSIMICFNENYKGFNVFEGSILYKNNVYRFDVNTNYESIIEIFGVPSDNWNDGIEKCAEYTIGKYYVEFIWNVENECTFDYLSIEPI